MLSAHSLDELIGLGSITPQGARFLEAAVVAGLNVIVAGGTQAGKTTLLNCLAATIPGRERVITCEEVFELKIPLPDVVSMQTRQANLEGTGEIQLRRLVKEALRMRPDRIIVGEVRQEECLDLLMVPLVYVLLTVFQVQRAAFGVTEAARSAGRAYATAETPAQAVLRAQEAADLAMRDQIAGYGSADVTFPAGQGLAPGGTVTVIVRHDVTLPLIGGLFGRVEPTIPVRATHVEVVDAFREEPGP